jgi:hypothetical protein
MSEEKLTGKNENEAELIEQDEKEFREYQLKHLPNEALVAMTTKLFHFLTAFVDENGKRPLDLIIEKGEIKADPKYYCSRIFTLAKQISGVWGDNPEVITINMQVKLTTFANVSPIEKETEIFINEGCLKKYNPPEAKP